MTHYIYALYSTRDGEIRYVGETANLDRRLRRPQEGENSRVQQWMETELWYGHQIEYAILEECAYEERKLREMTYMAKCENLLNVQNRDIIGFYRDRNDLEKEKVFECRQAIERFRKSVDWNYEGFSGIARWNRDLPFPVFTAQVCIKFNEEHGNVNPPPGIKRTVEVSIFHTEFLENEFEEFSKAKDARDALIERLKSRFTGSLVFPDKIDRT